jgi:CubicO group peptidase (beta-lactamase class C family)
MTTVADAVLARSAARIRAAGPPGVHLSVAADGWRGDAVIGLAQQFDESGPRPIPLTAGHAHDLGSVTKIAGTVAMLAALTTKGRIALGDPLGTYLPGLPGWLASQTVRTVLRHRAGLWEWWPLYLGNEPPLAAIAALSPRYAPRTGRHYSDLGFMLLGALVEAVVGQPLDECHRLLVTEPLRISGLAYAAAPRGGPAIASSVGDRIEREMVRSGRPYPVGGSVTTFHDWRTRVLVGEVNDGNAFHAFGGAAGHAGLFGTVDALHRLGAAMLLSLPAYRAEKPTGPWPTLGLFVEPGPDESQLLGFRHRRHRTGGCEVDIIEHPGFPGVGFALIPAHRATVVLATNRLHTVSSPTPFEPLWADALRSAHECLHHHARNEPTHGDEATALHTEKGYLS